MKRIFLLGLVVFGVLCCHGFAKDVTNGASQTEREIKGERRHTTPDADAGAAGDDASISM